MSSCWSSVPRPFERNLWTVPSAPTGKRVVSRYVAVTSVCSFRTDYHVAWNLACGFAQNESQLLAFRFLAGLGGSAPLAVCSASRITVCLINLAIPDRWWCPR